MGAASRFGGTALMVGTTVKLARALWIVLMTLATAAVKHSTSKIHLPWFILILFVSLQSSILTSRSFLLVRNCCSSSGDWASRRRSFLSEVVSQARRCDMSAGGLWHRHPSVPGGGSDVALLHPHGLDCALTLQRVIVNALRPRRAKASVIRRSAKAEPKESRLPVASRSSSEHAGRVGRTSPCLLLTAPFGIWECI